MSCVRSIVCLIALSLSSVVLVLAGTAAPADAQERAECPDGPGNARNQVRDNITDAILGEISDWIQDHPWEPEGVDEFYNRCAGGLPTGPPPGYSQSLPGGPGSSGRRGSSSGDPHIVTQDGARYSFHASGDFTLLETLDGETTMQIRFRGNGPMTTFDGLAVAVDNVRFSMNTFAHGKFADFYIDDELIELPADGWYDLGIGFVLHTNNVFTVRLDSGIIVLAQRSGLSLFTPDEIAGQFVGLHGNGDADPANDLVLRDGTPIDASDATQLYGDFFEAWAVAPQISLFGAPGAEPSPPTEIITLGDLDDDAVESAATLCMEAGFVAGAGLDECVFDVALTGDAVWTLDVPSAATNPAAIPADLLSSTTEPTVIDALANVSNTFADQRTRSYSVPATNVDRTLRVQPPCASFGAPVASITADGRPIQSVALTCDAVVSVPSGAFELRVANPSDREPGFNVVLGEVAVLDLGRIEPGANVTGSLPAGDRATGVLDLAAGSRLFLDASDATGCAATIEITDATGAVVLANRSACLDHGPFMLDGTAPFSVTISPLRATSFDLTFTIVDDDVASPTAVGQEIALEVTTSGQTASANVVLELDERIYVESIASTPGAVSVLDPLGSEVARALSVNDVGLVQATISGSYTLRFEPNGAEIGTQRLRVIPVADDVRLSASPGEMLELAVASAGQLGMIDVDLAAGQRLYVETIESFEGSLTWTDPDGGEQRVVALNDIGLVEAQSAGIHTLTIAGRGAATGTQSITLHQVADDVISAARVGDLVDLEIRTPGQLAGATLELAAGDSVVITNLSEISGTMTVVDPEGEIVLTRPAQIDIGELNVALTGTYTIELRGADATFGTQTLMISPN